MLFDIWLTLLPYIGPVKARYLLKQFGNAKTVYNVEPAEIEEMRGLSLRQKKSLIENKSLNKAEQILQKCRKYNISVLTIENPLYPDRAKMIKDAPTVIYYKGTIKKMEKTVGIVGARRCSQQDKQKAVKIAEYYTEKQNAIISGMAKGIDSYVQTACLKLGGYTVAVLGNGLDICYPEEHRLLMKRIEEKGLLISEYPPGTLPAKYNFPRRNRLISAWSDELVVISPGKGSGSLITAKYSENYGRKVKIIVQSEVARDFTT
ncbi:DNA protecting protein DprA [uncultured Blautia sp.]|nr:DNA-processing protein DprA [uncultured Blautia sp.]SCI01421.1 DNA protecting protein DprA [uncultured Blautia sp.]